MVWGSSVRFENTKNIEIAGFKGRQSLKSGNPVIKLKMLLELMFTTVRRLKEP
jgi:hypothetical protein